jgi:hypothetical protein
MESQKQEEQGMPKKFRAEPTADEIAEMTTRGEDVSKLFTNKFTVVRSVRRVNADLTEGNTARTRYPSRTFERQPQAVIKTLLQRSIDQDSAPRPRE